MCKKILLIFGQFWILFCVFEDPFFGVRVNIIPILLQWGCKKTLVKIISRVRIISNNMWSSYKIKWYAKYFAKCALFQLKEFFVKSGFYSSSSKIVLFGELKNSMVHYCMHWDIHVDLYGSVWVIYQRPQI